MPVPVEEILKLLEVDEEVVAKGKDRQDAIWNNREADYIPILIGGAVPETREFPEYDLREQFFDKEKMLAGQLWAVITQARGRSDSQLSLRANLGVGLVPTIFGLEEQVFEDKMPWLKEHLSKEEILGFQFPEDITQAGLMPLAIEYIKFFREKLDGKAHVYLCDTQGPFDIAHLVRGNAMFTDLHDDPDFVHHLLRLTTRAYVECTKAMKAVNGERLNSGYHGVNLCMGNGGVRVCEDTSTLLSPSMIKEFVVPYLKEALRPFGGGWVHFCGKNDSLFDFVTDVEEMRGINFGNPEMYDYGKVMNKLLDRGKFYYGGWPKKEGESTEEYFKRILGPVERCRKGLIFAASAGDGEKADDVISLWRSLQV